MWVLSILNTYLYCWRYIYEVSLASQPLQKRNRQKINFLIYAEKLMKHNCKANAVQHTLGKLNYTHDNLPKEGTSLLWYCLHEDPGGPLPSELLKNNSVSNRQYHFLHPVGKYSIITNTAVSVWGISEHRQADFHRVLSEAEKLTSLMLNIGSGKY